MKKWMLLALLALVVWRCAEPTQNTAKTTKVVCTTSMIADAMRHIMPEGVEVIALMGPGVDPHLYKATQGDLEKLQQADIIVYNGLHLEGKMGEIMEKLGRQKVVIAVGDGLPKEVTLVSQTSAGNPDPHIWFDLSLWATALGHVKNRVVEAFPAMRETMEANYFAYQQDLLATHNWAIQQMAQIPENQRVLITAHDAFGYFGRAYHLRVRGLQGISTASEYGLQDISNLVTFIVNEKIPAVFVESSVPKKSIEAVISGCRSRGHNVMLGGQLYSDALGEAGTETGTLIGAFKANVEAITYGLKTAKTTAP